MGPTLIDVDLNAHDSTSQNDGPLKDTTRIDKSEDSSIEGRPGSPAESK